MTFKSLLDALRAGFLIFEKHPGGYVVRREIPTEGGRRWVHALVEVTERSRRP